jgi:hypothetical protein
MRAVASVHMSLAVSNIRFNGRLCFLESPECGRVADGGMVLTAAHAWRSFSMLYGSEQSIIGRTLESDLRLLWASVDFEFDMAVQLYVHCRRLHSSTDLVVDQRSPRIGSNQMR